MRTASGRLSAIAGGLLGLALLSQPASAQPPNGFYVSGEAGATFQSTQQLSGNGVTAHTEPDTGLAVLGAFGYRFWDDFRIEEEPGFRRATISKINGMPATGSLSALSAMSNLVYDIPLGLPITPFVGAGIGFAYTGFNSISPVGGLTVKDNDTVFVMQGIAGVSYNVTDNLQIVATYRYFAPDGSNVENSAGVKLQGADQSHTVTVGLRWNFGEAEAAPAAPPPAAAPAPAPAAAPPAPAPAVRSFVVFFAFDSAMLDDSAKKIVAEAVAYSRENQLSRIEVVGHTDKSGPEKYNERLSLRRANAVKADMIRLGLPADQIAVSAKGMSDPAVPTPIGVREPRNRRAEITF